MAGFMPGIHVLQQVQRKSWMAGTSPAMTKPERREEVSYSFATEMSGASSFFMPTT
jgi:hypothetical protein